MNFPGHFGSPSLQTWRYSLEPARKGQGCQGRVPGVPAWLWAEGGREGNNVIRLFFFVTDGLDKLRRLFFPVWFLSLKICAGETGLWPLLQTCYDCTCCGLYHKYDYVYNWQSWYVGYRIINYNHLKACSKLWHHFSDCHHNHKMFKVQATRSCCNLGYQGQNTLAYLFLKSVTKKKK